jgi:protein arginine N-methyltransferase 1
LNVANAWLSEELAEEHLSYIGDPKRTAKYQAAIGRVVGRESVVVDLGCGSGILGLLCLQAGAARVVGIDSSSIAIFAQDTFARAGFAGRYEFVFGRSFLIEPSGLADVAICDHVGCFGFDYGIAELLADARRRFLTPKGVVVPRRIRLSLGLVDSVNAHEKIDRWRTRDIPPEYHWFADIGVNTRHRFKFTAAEIVSQPTTLGDIDLTRDPPEFFSWSAELSPSHDGVLHGLAGWFDCELAEGVWMTNSPFAEDAINRAQVFLPIGNPVAIRAGERVSTTVMARPRENLIAWRIDLPRTKQTFSHSTWQGTLLGLPDLKRSNPERVPRPNRNGRARGIVLSYCDGVRTAQQVEEIVLKEHPNLFPSAGVLTRFVAEVLAKDTD